MRLRCEDVILAGLAWSFIPTSTDLLPFFIVEIQVLNSKSPDAPLSTAPSHVGERLKSRTKTEWSGGSRRATAGEPDTQPHPECKSLPVLVGNSTLKVTSLPGADTAQNTSSIDKNA